MRRFFFFTQISCLFLKGLHFKAVQELFFLYFLFFIQIHLLHFFGLFNTFSLVGFVSIFKTHIFSEPITYTNYLFSSLLFYLIHERDMGFSSIEHLQRQKMRKEINLNKMLLCNSLSRMLRKIRRILAIHYLCSSGYSTGWKYYLVKSRHFHCLYFVFQHSFYSK